MQVLSVKVNNTNTNTNFVNYNQNFGHSHKALTESNYKPSEKALIASMSVIGVLCSLAALAKGAKYSLKPSKMFKDIKNSYIANMDFKAKEVIAMGAGSCLGGLAAGAIIDKNPQNVNNPFQNNISYF